MIFSASIKLFGLFRIILKVKSAQKKSGKTDNYITYVEDFQKIRLKANNFGNISKTTDSHDSHAHPPRDSKAGLKMILLCTKFRTIFFLNIRGIHN